MLTAPPTPSEVIAYLDGDDTLSDLAATRIANVIAMTRAYTRGIGFGAGGTVAEDIKAVIVSAVARELNASPGVLREEMGSYSVLYDGQAYGFTIREQVILNAYRRSAT